MPALAEIDGHTFYLPALGPASVVFDLGAAGGTFSRTLRDLAGCRCIAADASPPAYEVLSKLPGVEAHHIALSGRDGPMAMEIGGHEDGGYWLRQSDRADGAPGEGAIEVEGVTFETLKMRCDVDFVDLIKLDIEGAEFDFFAAASDEALARVGQWSVEFHDFLDPTLAPEVAEVIRRLEGLGFEAIVMTRRGHGDVLFLNRAHLGLDAWQLFCMRWPLKYGRGIRRMLARGFGIGSGKQAA